MKKVFAILLVMTVVAGFVFADTKPATGTTETHTITVNTSVGVIVPVFNFVVNSAETNKTAKFDTSTASDPDLKAEDTTVLKSSDSKEIVDAAISQTFTIKSMAVCNIKQNYELAVTATQFVRQIATGEDSTKDAYTTKGGDISIVHAAPTTAIASTEHITVVAETSKLTATFNGKQVSTGITLGTATVTWPQDPDAIPGDYKADVTLTVTAK